MKTLLCVIFLGSVSCFLKAQTYQPMAVEGAHWVVRSDRLSTLWLDDKFIFSVRGDTVVNDLSYKKVYRDAYEFDEDRKVFLKTIVSSSLYALMRDDTTGRKVYAIMGETAYDNCVENEEYLLFDFSLTQGDTLSWCSLQEFKLNSEIPQIVDSSKVTYSYPTGDDRNTLYAVLPLIGYLDATITEGSMPIIEGFGYEQYGPFLVGTSVEKYCVGTLEECELITGLKELHVSDIRVYPNPAHDFIKVDLPDSYSGPFYYRLLNSQGQLIRKGQIAGNLIRVNHIQGGLYFISVYYVHGKMFTKGIFIK